MCRFQVLTRSTAQRGRRIYAQMRNHSKYGGFFLASIKVVCLGCCTAEGLYAPAGLPACSPACLLSPPCLLSLFCLLSPASPPCLPALCLPSALFSLPAILPACSHLHAYFILPVLSVLPAFTRNRRYTVNLVTAGEPRRAFLARRVDFKLHRKL